MSNIEPVVTLSTDEAMEAYVAHMINQPDTAEVVPFAEFDTDALEARFQKMLAGVWRAGRESIGHDLSKPLVDGIRASTPNPYEK